MGTQMQNFDVQVEVSVKLTFKVNAATRAEAIAKAEEQAYRDYLTAEPDSIDAHGVWCDGGIVD